MASECFLGSPNLCSSDCWLRFYWSLVPYIDFEMILLWLEEADMLVSSLRPLLLIIEVAWNGAVMVSPVMALLEL